MQCPGYLRLWHRNTSMLFDELGIDFVCMLFGGLALRAQVGLVQCQQGCGSIADSKCVKLRPVAENSGQHARGQHAQVTSSCLCCRTFCVR